MQPHLLVEPYLNSLSPTIDQTIEAQWRTIVWRTVHCLLAMHSHLLGGLRQVDDLRKEGNFGNTVAIVDVSGSMHGIPMLVAITLGLIVAGTCSHVCALQPHAIILLCARGMSRVEQCTIP